MFKLKPWMSLSMLGTLLIASTSFAALPPSPAPYVGAQVGWGKVHKEGVELSDVQLPPLTVTNFSSSTDHRSGWAGRLFAGYLFSQMWGVEIGWSKFTDIDNDVMVTYSNGATINKSPTIKTDAIDLVAKGIYYFYDNFNIYGKLGAAYILQSNNFKTNVAGNSITVDKDINRLYPTFSLGLGYDFYCNWTADISWTRIQKVGNSEASSTDLATVGLIYKFV